MPEAQGGTGAELCLTGDGEFLPTPADGGRRRLANPIAAAVVDGPSDRTPHGTTRRFIVKSIVDRTDGWCQ